MSSGISTERRPADADAGFRAWHLYVLLSMIGATVAVMKSRYTHPVALLLLSAAVLGTGLVGLALHRAFSGFLGGEIAVRPLDDRTREQLEREKALALRSIKELEFDHSMGKVSDKDFHDLSGRLRARAMSLMQDIDRASSAKAAAGPAARRGCAACGAANDRDAKFCKQCGKRLEREA